MLYHLLQREALRGVGVEDRPDEHARLVGNVVVLDGKGQLVLADLAVGDLLAAAVERRLADQHRVGDHADRPDVHFVGVGALVVRLQNLRRDVVRSAAHRLLALVRLVQLRRETQVAHLHLQVLVEEDVAQFEIAVDDAALVEVAHRVDDLQQKVLYLRLGEALPDAKQMRQRLPRQSRDGTRPRSSTTPE